LRNVVLEHFWNTLWSSIQTEISVVGCMVRASARQNFDGDGRTPIDDNAVYGDLDKSDA